MKLRLRIIIALYAGFLLSSLLQFIWGEAGVIRINTMKSHRDRLVENIAGLEEINGDLALERDALLYDEAEIQLRAMAFGFYRDNEVPVKLPGNKQSYAYTRTLGTLVRKTPDGAGSKQLFRLFFLCVSGTVFAATFLWRKHGANSPGQ